MRLVLRREYWTVGVRLGGVGKCRCFLGDVGKRGLRVKNLTRKGRRRRRGRFHSHIFVFDIKNLYFGYFHDKKIKNSNCVVKTTLQ